MGLALLVLGVLTLRPRQRQSVEQRLAIIIFGAVLVGATFLVFGDLVVGKITQQGLRDESRLAPEACSTMSSPQKEIEPLHQWSALASQSSSA